MVYELEGELVLDLDRREIRRGRTPVGMQPKAFDLLAHLVQHRARVVDKAELQAVLWPAEHVTGSSLTFCINLVRRALGDTGRAQRYLRTVRGSGYRFVGACVPRPAPRRRPRIQTREWATPFVGRASERSTLRSCLDDARRGRGQICFVTGDAGLGKTRLVDEFVAGDVAADVTVTIGRCEEHAEAAFLPWAQVVDTWLEAQEDDADRVLGTAASDLFRLVPRIATVRPEVASQDVLEPEQARTRLFASFTSFLQRAAGEAPLLLVLDDLHWADASSLVLLRIVSAALAESPAMVLATYRDADPDRPAALDRALHSIRRRARTTDVPLPLMSRDETRVLVAALAPDSADVDVTEAVCRATEGHPFLIEETCRHLAQAGPCAAGTLPGGKVPLARSVREAVGFRLGALGTTVGRLVAAAAVVGRAARPTLLGAVAGLDPASCAQAIDDAVRARVLCHVAGERVRFVHPLVADAALATLRPSGRSQLHRTAADVLQRSDAEGEPHPAEIARHLIAAGGPSDLDAAVGWSLRAGARAAGELAFIEAAAHYTQAESLSRDPAQRFTALHAAGDAHYKAGDTRRAMDLLARAAALARSLQSPGAMALAGIALRGGSVLAPSPDARALLEAALAVPDGLDPALRARTLGALAGVLYLEPETAAQRTALCDEALALARDSNDPQALVHARGDRLAALWHPGLAAERIAEATELVELGTALDQPSAVTTGLGWRAVARLEHGDVAGFVSDLERYADLAERICWPGYRFAARGFAATRAFLLGRFDEAERHADSLLRLPGAPVGPEAFASYVVALVPIRLAQGRLAEIEGLLPGGDGRLGRQGQWLRALVFAASDRHEDARALLATMADTGFADLPAVESFNVYLPALAALTQVASDLGDRAPRDAVEGLRRRLEPFADAWVVGGLGVSCVGSVQHWLGLLAATTGAMDEARVHMEAALGAHAHPETPALLVATRFAWARELRRRGGRDAQRRAGRLLDEAGRDAEMIGWSTMLQRIGHLEHC